MSHGPTDPTPLERTLDRPPSPEGGAEEAPDPLEALAGRLNEPGTAAELKALSREDLLRVATVALGAARDLPDAEAQAGLEVLRRACLLANEREILGLVLRGLADVAVARGDGPGAMLALDKLGGLMELTKRPGRAHDAWLELAAAQELAGEAEAAELTLMHAVSVARGMASGVGRAEQLAATERLGKTLKQLGTLMVNQGRFAEGQAWLEGAEDLL